MIKKLFLPITILLLPLSGCVSGCNNNGGAAGSGPGGKAGDTEIPGQVVPVELEKIARVTGAPLEGERLPDPNRTVENYHLAATDLGVIWDNGRGEVFIAFGDNFDVDLTDWKSNALAISSDRDLSDGLSFSGMIMNGDRVKELIVSGRKQGQQEGDPEFEITCIPTGGVSVGSRHYIYYMSVHEWALGGDNDAWLLNYGEIAYSDDGGQNWTKSGVKWDGRGNFPQAYYLREGGKVYMLGTPAGRYGNVHLARVDEDRLLEKDAYEYWTGGDWSPRESDAVAVTNGTTSEFSVMYNSYYRKYFMIYLSVNSRAIVFRTADELTGDWSAEKIIMHETGEALYAPYFHPWFNDSQDLYFVISHASPTWNIFLMKGTLENDPTGSI